MELSGINLHTQSGNQTGDSAMNLPGNSRIYHGGGMNRGVGFTSSSGSSLINKDEVILSHVDFQTAGLTKTNVLFSLPAGNIVLFTRLKSSVVFAGGAITNYYLALGITGGLQDLMTEYDAMNIVVGDQEYAESFAAQSFDYNNAVNLQVTARSVGANLSESLTGSAVVEIYHLSKV